MRVREGTLIEGPFSGFWGPDLWLVDWPRILVGCFFGISKCAMFAAPRRVIPDLFDPLRHHGRLICIA